MKQKACLITILVFALLVGISCRRDNNLSDELVGGWKTSSFQYRETSFELRKNRIIFKTKEGDINTHPIIRVKKEKVAKEEWILYTIYYLNNEMRKVEFSFYYRPLEDGLIIFKNQKNLVWKKEKG